MATTSLSSPFGREPLTEVALPRAPLASTLAQIRFPNQAILALGDDAARRVVEALTSTYPVFNLEHGVEFLVTPDGVQRQEGVNRVWRLSSPDKTWKVGFAQNFVSLETTAYTSRDDFSRRLGEVWDGFIKVVAEPAIERIGFRYINRVSDRGFLDRLGDMVRPEIIGAAFAGQGAVPIYRSLTENVYVRSQQDQLLARYGLLAAGETLDPAIQPQQDVSWVLDLDSYRSFASPMPGADVPTVVHELGAASYRYFRWAVTEDFLRFFGGDPA